MEWNKVIKIICEYAKANPSTEMILNWSWEAVNRNLPTNRRKKVLSKTYGIPLYQIEPEFRLLDGMWDYLDKYICQLKSFFEYVIPVGVPKEHRTIRPKLTGHRKYFLLYCTNSKQRLELVEYKMNLIKEDMREKFNDLQVFLQAK